MTIADDAVVGVSVFAGIGGLEFGFDQLGIPTAVQIEWDPKAREVLEARYPDAVRFGDVREVTGDDVRAAVGGRRVGFFYGGFPCQDVSVAGRRAGMAGDRSSLYTELVRLADDLDPDWLVVENVPGLLSADADPDANGGRECRESLGKRERCPHPVRPETGTAHGLGNGTAFAVVLGDVTGYRPPVPAGGWRNSGVCSGPRRSAAWRVLDARHFGVAQRRRRVFVVACARDRTAPAAVLLEPEGVRGNPPPGEPPRPRFATRAARAAARAGVAGPDGAGEGDVRDGARGVLADSGVVSALTGSFGMGGADAAHAHAGWMVPTEGEPLAADARNGTIGDVAGTLQSHGESYSLNAQPTVVGRESGPGFWTEGDEAQTLCARGHKDHGGTVIGQPNEEVGALTATGGPAHLDDQATQQLVVEDPARPVAVRGRDAGAQAELGSEPLANALRAGDGSSSRQPTVLAYEVDKERGVANDEGVKVTETDVAPPLLADGDPAERTDRGLRVVQAWGISSDAIDRSGEGAGGTPGERPGLGIVEESSPALRARHPQSVAAIVEDPRPFRKQRRAADPTDDETWVEGDVANTLNSFDGGDTRATEVVVETVAVAAGAHTHTTDDGAVPAVTASKQGPGSVAAYPIGQDALRGAGVAESPSADAEGRVRLRDPGLGVYDDGEPAATVTAAGPGAVGVTRPSSTAAVRRLTPLECERLQGFPDLWTGVQKASDSTRYRQLGNAVCAAVSSWLAWRIQAYRNGWRPA